jgi:cell division protein FtsN
MRINKTRWAILGAVLLAICACSRQQSDWQKTRETNTTDAYELFIKKYPTGEFTGQAQARLKDLYEERDWQKARDTDTQEAYQAFLKQYPEGKWTEEARIRVENFTLAQTPSTSSPGSSGPGPGAALPAPATGSGTARTTAEAGAHNPPSAPPAAQAPPEPSPSKTAAPPHEPPSHAKFRAKPAAGAYAVQLGAFRSGTAVANKRWARLQKEYPKLLTGLSSKVVPKQIAGGKTLYRLQAVGVTEAHARRICKDLKAKSQPCIVVRAAET